jgi:uncharacterized protein YukE
MDVIGFDVRDDAARAATSTAGDLADQLAALRRTWSSAADQPVDAFGYVELTAEYQTMVDAWFAEIGTHIEVLEELSAEVDDAADVRARARPGP